MALTVGTAGHIDHGKTWLVRALTGKDTDRLPEEQRRGISIDLGYAPLELPDGRRLSLIDVPGHERFVRTMVAGATGIDLFLLVIDAAEGARPQTLVARVKAIVLNGYSAGVDFSDGEDELSGYERAEQLARELGQKVATDAGTFATVLPLIVTNQQGRHWMFGAGLADKAPRLEECWGALTRAFEATREEQRSVQAMRGFLSAVYERDRNVFEHILNEAMESASLVD